jgi:4-hydroxybenzoate polyprenyltransferase
MTRPRWRSYLLLARVSNLPTVWSNTLAGATAAAGAGLLAADARVLGVVVVAASLFYVGGMFLNDAFDAAVDAAQRPERPIPSGDLSRREAFAVGFTALGVAELLLLPHPPAAVLGLLLAGAIVLYDTRHKGVPWAPLVMGACRGLVYGIAAVSLGSLTSSAVTGAAVMVAYVAALTVVAKTFGRRVWWIVPVMIAGISLVDAAFIVVVSGGPTRAAFLAALGFPLTLVLQRVVPGD